MNPFTNVDDDDAAGADDYRVWNDTIDAPPVRRVVDAETRTHQAEVTRARLAKANAIARVLEEAGALGCDIPLLDDKGRRAAEALAGVRRGSDDTWALVADILATRALLASHLPADPFSVFPS